MKTLNRRDFPGAQYPERIIQFGEGNFLRAFVDWQIDLLNEHTDLNSGVVVVRPIETSFPPSLSTQDGLYTTIIRGLNEKGEAVSDARLIRSVNREISVYSEYDEFLKLAHNPEMRFVFSNTTEAGISYHAGDKFDDAPAVSYPAKLTRLLFERFSHFNGALDKGWIIIPCELIDYNGDALRELVLRYAQEWALPEAFIQWLDQANSFCSTLVDRIVTGYPRDEVAKLEEELGYHDGFLDTAEHFYLFVIQGPKSLATELRLDKYPLNVLIVDDIKPYKERKVAILNGAHTALVPVAFQAGLDTVGEAMNDAEICAFVEKAIYEEHKRRQERMKAYIEAIKKQDFPIDAERLVTNYFKTAKKDPDGAQKMLENNPATFAPIQIDKLKPRFFGMIKPKPEDGIRVNKEIGKFLKDLKA